jgi:predicted transcriptional regulator
MYPQPHVTGSTTEFQPKSRLIILVSRDQVGYKIISATFKTKENITNYWHFLPLLYVELGAE